MRRALLALVACLALTAPAHAQTFRTAIGPHGFVYLETAGAPSLQVLVTGTMWCAIDGAELDGGGVRSASGIPLAGTPIVFPTGTQFVGRRGAHEYVFAVPNPRRERFVPIALNVPALAAQRLVGTQELTASLVGSIEAVVIAGASDAQAGSVPLEAATSTAVVMPGGLAYAGGAALGVPLLALALVLRRRRRAVSADAALMARAARARATIVREARVLGPAFDGALASATSLADAATRQREHLVALDRAIARTAWVKSEGAVASLATLRARRAAGLATLETLVAQLEDTVVRMAGCVADRSAIAGLERDLSRARSELEVGESVEHEVAAIGA